jgi:hypothetical protein
VGEERGQFADIGSGIQDKSYVLGSAEHQKLVKDAIHAKLAQNPDLATRFVAARPRHLCTLHQTKRAGDSLPPPFAAS